MLSKYLKVCCNVRRSVMMMSTTTMNRKGSKPGKTVAAKIVRMGTNGQRVGEKRRQCEGDRESGRERVWDGFE